MWNRECDNVFKSYMPILKDLYARYSGAKAKPGQKKFVSLDELKRLCTDCDLYAEGFQDREIAIAFNNSVMIQVDEVNYDRHLQLYFVEFIEAFGRIAEKAALIPYSPKVIL